MRQLQIPSDTSSFMCDPPFKDIFGEDKLKFFMVTQKITPHISPPGHIHLEHGIKLSGGSPVGNTCYDVLVDVPLLLEREMSSFVANMEKNKEIDACDETISSVVRKIHEHLRRRAFFLGFSQSPAEFINTLIASQASDLNLLLLMQVAMWRKSIQQNLQSTLMAEDAVIRYLNRKPAVGSEAAGNK
ncbi:hypothetical protein OROMI_003586 [Orobanche minor]